jgi:hypothetical protein
METANMMRVNARSGSFAGQGNAQQDRQQQHRQKVYALFDAIDSENLEASKQAFQALINFEPRTSANPQFDRLSKLLNAGSIYLAQQLIKDIKSSWINAQPLNPLQQQKSPIPTKRIYGLHIVDVRA